MGIHACVHASHYVHDGAAADARRSRCRLTCRREGAAWPMPNQLCVPCVCRRPPSAAVEAEAEAEALRWGHVSLYTDCRTWPGGAATSFTTTAVPVATQAPSHSQPRCKVRARPRPQPQPRQGQGRRHSWRRRRQGGSPLGDADRWPAGGWAGGAQRPSICVCAACIPNL